MSLGSNTDFFSMSALSIAKRLKFKGESAFFPLTPI